MICQRWKQGKIVSPRGPADFGRCFGTPSHGSDANSVKDGMPFSNMMDRRKFDVDVLTLPADSRNSYAEMDKAAKNKISHRGLALAKLQDWFAQQRVD